MITKLPEQDSSYFQTLTESIGVTPSTLLFCAFHCAKPFFEAAAEKLLLPADEEDIWMKRNCPYAEAPPSFQSLIKKTANGSCTACCAVQSGVLCGCSAQNCNCAQTDGMKFIAEEGGPWRIDVCDQCRGYMKTFDEKKAGGITGGFVPAVADVATLYLDLFAEKEGYKKLFFFPPETAAEKGADMSETIH